MVCRPYTAPGSPGEARGLWPILQRVPAVPEHHPSALRTEMALINKNSNINISFETGGEMKFRSQFKLEHQVEPQREKDQQDFEHYCIWPVAYRHCKY